MALLSKSYMRIPACFPFFYSWCWRIRISAVCRIHSEVTVFAKKLHFLKKSTAMNHTGWWTLRSLNPLQAVSMGDEYTYSSHLHITLQNYIQCPVFGSIKYFTLINGMNLRYELLEAIPESALNIWSEWWKLGGRARKVDEREVLQWWRRSMKPSQLPVIGYPWISTPSPSYECTLPHSTELCLNPNLQNDSRKCLTLRSVNCDDFSDMGNPDAPISHTEEDRMGRVRLAGVSWRRCWWSAESFQRSPQKG